MSEEEIAARLKMKPDKVKQAITAFEQARASVNNEIVDMAVNTEALIALDGVGDDLRDARQALRWTGAYDSIGDPIFERDHSLMLDSVTALGALVEKTRPKGGGVTVNTAIQNNGSNGGGQGQGRSFEALLREAKAQRQLTDGGSGGLAMADIELVEDAEFDGDLDDPDDAGVNEEQDNGE